MKQNGTSTRKNTKRVGDLDWVAMQMKGMNEFEGGTDIPGKGTGLGGAEG